MPADNRITSLYDLLYCLIMLHITNLVFTQMSVSDLCEGGTLGVTTIILITLSLFLMFVENHIIFAFANEHSQFHRLFLWEFVFGTKNTILVPWVLNFFLAIRPPPTGVLKGLCYVVLVPDPPLPWGGWMWKVS